MHNSSSNLFSRAARKIIPLISMICICATTRAVAQSATTTQAGNLLLPGTSDVSTVHFRDTTISYHVVMDRAPNGDPTSSDRGSYSKETRHVTYQGRPAIVFVRTINTNGRTYVDSSAVLSNGMIPLWEVSTLGTRRTTYAYSGAKVRRSLTQPDSAKKVVEHDFGTPMFYFEALDDIIRSVPLRAGYQAVVPLYSEGDDGIEMDTVRVEGRDSAGVWNVRFADPVIIAQYGIDGKTRNIVRHEIGRHADRAHFRYVFDNGKR